MNYNDDVLLTTNSAQQSYGIIFDVQTTSNSGVVQITSVEFYTPLTNATVGYEIMTKRGSWHGFEGKERVFTKIASGNITIPPNRLNEEEGRERERRELQNNNGFGIGFGNGINTAATSQNQNAQQQQNNNEDAEIQNGLIRIPPSQFTPINLNGNGDRHSLYITLTTKDLIYARSSTTQSSTSQQQQSIQSITSIEQITQNPTFDTIKLLETEELIVYEGAAVMIHPFNYANQRIYYRKPRGFVGRIWYNRMPCEEIEIVVVGEEDDGVNGTTNATDLNLESIAEENDGGRTRRGGGGRRKRELTTTQVTNWKDCIPISQEEEEMTSLNEMPPLFLGTPQKNQASNNNKNNDFNGTAPTASPTILNVPTIYTMKVNLIITLHNVNSSTIYLATGQSINRILNNQEQNEYERTTIDFYESQELLEVNEVELYGCKIHYQQIFNAPESLENYDGSLRRRRRLQDVGGQEGAAGFGNTVGIQQESTNSISENAAVSEEEPVLDSTAVGLENNGNANGPANNNETTTNETSTTVESESRPPPPNIILPGQSSKVKEEEEFEQTETSLEITLIISVLYSPLPLQITQDLLQTLLTNNEMSYISILKSNPILSTYFSTLDALPSVIVVDELTEPPTLQPSNAPTPYVTTEDDIVREPMSTTQVVIVISLLLYFVALCCGFVYVRRARRVMRVQRAKAFLSDGGVGGANGHATAYIPHDMVYEEENKNDDKKKKKKSAPRRKSSFMQSMVGKKRRGSKVSNSAEDDEEMMGLRQEQYKYHSDDDDESNSKDDEDDNEEGDRSLSSMEDSYYSEEESYSEESEESDE